MTNKLDYLRQENQAIRGQEKENNREKKRKRKSSKETELYVAVFKKTQT